MKVLKEVGRIVLVLVITGLLVALLYQLPWFLALVLIVPLGLAITFWPETSTVLSYIVAAVFGTVLTGWSLLAAVESPEQMYFAFIWLPLVWGPAGVVIKRIELLIVHYWNKRKMNKYELPRL